MSTNNVHLLTTNKLFIYYKLLGEKAMDQLTEKQLFQSIQSESNSIATIVNHLSGNMLSRWTNFLTTDGEKEWRNREKEFENPEGHKNELLIIWNKGWNCLFETLDVLTDSDLEKIIYIRNQGHTVQEAINRQLGHYAYHIGQIVYVAKMLANENWKSLSIPKGESNKYNDKKFSLQQSKQHFTDEFTNDRDK